MLPNSDVENDSIYFHKYFKFKHSSHLYNFIFDDGPVGVVYIDLVDTNDLHVKALSDEAQEMCESGTNAGGRSEISEGLSYETFYRWGDTKLVKVSRVMSCVHCNVFSGVMF